MRDIVQNMKRGFVKESKNARRGFVKDSKNWGHRLNPGTRFRHTEVSSQTRVDETSWHTCQSTTRKFRCQTSFVILARGRTYQWGVSQGVGHYRNQ